MKVGGPTAFFLKYVVGGKVNEGRRPDSDQLWIPNSDEDMNVNVNIILKY
jgi:hypothetical protein